MIAIQQTLTCIRFMMKVRDISWTNGDFAGDEILQPQDLTNPGTTTMVINWIVLVLYPQAQDMSLIP